MIDVLEKDNALTTAARKALAEQLRNQYHYTLPKAVDGVFSVYCLNFEDFDRNIGAYVPNGGAVAFLLEDGRDKATIDARLRDKSLRGEYGVPKGEFSGLLYTIGADGQPQLAARYENGRKRKAA